MENEELKMIRLVPDLPYTHKLDIAIYDFPEGIEKEPRHRFGITAEYSKYDVAELKKRGMDLEGAMAYYEDWIYHMVRNHILSDWQAESGLDESMKIIEEHIREYF